MADTAAEFREEVLPELVAARKSRAAVELASREKELDRVRKEVFGAEAGAARSAARGGSGGGGEGEEEESEQGSGGEEEEEEEEGGRA